MVIELQERIGSRAQPSNEIVPIGGINTDLAPTELAIDQSPNSQNVVFHKLSAMTRTGLATLGTLTNITGIPIGAWEYIKLNQTRYIIVLTTNGLFSYISATDSWEDINNGSVTISSGAGDFGSSAFFPQGGVDMFIMSNGNDPLIKYTGSGNAALLGGCADANIDYAKIVRRYKDYCILMNCQISGTAIPQRLIWSDIADPENYLTGTTGQYDILSNGTEIKAAEMLGSILYIYMEDSIVGLVWVGGRDVFRWNIVVPESGLFGRRLVADFGDFHIFKGADGIYIFDGTRQLRSITENRVGRGLIETMNSENSDNAFSVVDRKFGLFSVFVPQGTEYWPRTRWTYNLSTRTWSKHKYDIYNDLLDSDGNKAGFTTAFLYREYQGLRWTDLSGSWLDQTWRWSDRDVGKGAPRIALVGSGDAVADRTGSVTGGDVYMETVKVLDDAGTTIDAFFETKDFQVGDMTYVVKLDFEAVGDSVDVAYSTDEGKSWIAIETVELDDSTYQRYEVYPDVLAERIRFRFRNNTNDELFSLRKFRFWAIPRND